MARRTGHHPLRALSRRRVVAVVVLVIWGMVLVGLSISKRAHEHVDTHQQRIHLVGEQPTLLPAANNSPIGDSPINAAAQRVRMGFLDKRVSTGGNWGAVAGQAQPDPTTATTRVKAPMVDRVDPAAAQLSASLSATQNPQQEEKQLVENEQSTQNEQPAQKEQSTQKEQPMQELPQHQEATAGQAQPDPTTHKQQQQQDSSVGSPGNAPTTQTQETPQSADTTTTTTTTTQGHTTMLDMPVTHNTTLPFAQQRRRHGARRQRWPPDNDGGGGGGGVKRNDGSGVLTATAADAAYGDGYGVGNYFDYATGEIQIPEHTQHEDDSMDITADTSSAADGLITLHQAEAYVAADVAHALRPWLQDCIHAQPLPPASTDDATDDNSPGEQALLLEPLLGAVRFATAAAFAGPQPFCHAGLAMQTRVLQGTMSLAIRVFVFGEDLGEMAEAIGLQEFRVAYQLGGKEHCSTIDDAVEQAVAQAAAAAGGALC